MLHPTLEDLNQQRRALDYLEDIKSSQIKMGMTSPMVICTYIDASFTVQLDSKSDIGICIWISMGQKNGCIDTRLMGQKFNTTSSYQAELVALAKGLLQ